MMGKYIGVDIGGTKIAVVFGDRQGNILKKERFENNLPPEQAIQRICALAAAFGPADGVGISCGGPLDTTRGRILSPPNLPGWDDIPITDLLQKATGCPAYLQNDANACALAEWKFGAGRGSNNMVFLTFGTGLGAGLILNGRLYEGTNGNAGEAGHIPLENRGPAGYGKPGSFEGFCSGGGIKKLAVEKAGEALRNNTPFSFCKTEKDLETVTAKTVADYALAGDENALAIYRICGEKLGKGLSILIDLLNPEKIVIGSIYCRAKELLYAPMMKTLTEQTLPDSLAVCQILPAELGEKLGDMAALSVAANGRKETLC